MRASIVLGGAVAFSLAAFSPFRNVAVVQAGVLLLILDASVHLLRYVATFLGREPYFPPRLKLAAALPLITSGIGVLLFYPSLIRQHRHATCVARCPTPVDLTG